MKITPNTETKYLRFERDFDAEMGKKTQIWDVVAKQGNIPLGKIKFRTAWRQYVYEPWPDTVLARSCLDDISFYITTLMSQRA